MAHNYGKAYEGESGLLFPAEEHETAFTSQIMSLIDTYTAQQSLLRAKEELEQLAELDYTVGETAEYLKGVNDFQEIIKQAINHLDKEIKASRLDAEGRKKI
jgi:hypothetical protein